MLIASQNTSKKLLHVLRNCGYGPQSDVEDYIGHYFI